jgi:acyl-CoA synthetase (AMP-forming)/AMP-acid ligase II
MDHPAVQQCVTFAVPHDKLGEDVAAAVVLREGVQTGEKGLREFAAKRLADFKVPRKILQGRPGEGPALRPRAKAGSDTACGFRATHLSRVLSETARAGSVIRTMVMQTLPATEHGTPRGLL